MLRLLKIVSLVLLGAWSMLRTAEEGFAFWVRRATRSRDFDGLVWA
jgi:hypothetical protein